MRIPRYIQYEITIAKEVFRPTQIFIKDHILVEALLTAIAALAVGIYEWTNSGQLPTSIFVGVLAGLFAASLIGSSVLLWNAFIASYRIWSRQLEELESSKFTFDPRVNAALEEFFVRGNHLLQEPELIFDNTQLISDWADEVSEFLEQNIPKERFMFYSAGGIFGDTPLGLIDLYHSREKSQQILRTKLAKLRLIIGRYENRPR